MNIDKLGTTLEQTTRRDRAENSSVSDRRVSSSAGPGSDELTLSDTARSLAQRISADAGSQIDSARVEGIRQAIADGTYHIDADRLAASFLDLESALDQ